MRPKEDAMEYLLALAALAIGFVLARRGLFDPDDYVHAAGLALLLALVILPAIPDAAKVRELATLGAPEGAIARHAFLQEHGIHILQACGLFVLGACAEAWLRRRRPYVPWN
jgi:hypothetical protein